MKTLLSGTMIDNLVLVGHAKSLEATDVFLPLPP
jgi:hypothetical protein